MVAHRTISGIRSPELWQFTVPQLAVQFPFLMHGMLALSALHLAKLRPERRRKLITKATTNESQALPSYRSTVKNPNQENIHAIFAFSGFVAQYSLAASKSWSFNDNRSTGVIEYETIDEISAQLVPYYARHFNHGLFVLHASDARTLRQSLGSPTWKGPFRMEPR